MKVSTMKTTTKVPDEPDDKTLVRVFVNNRERPELEWSYVFERDDETSEAFERDPVERRWYAQGVDWVATWLELVNLAECIEVLAVTATVWGVRPLCQ